MSIGDVHSDARGSGARYNDGKPALELIPLGMIAESFDDLDTPGSQDDARWALALLGSFQETGDVNHLISAISQVHLHWRECAAVFAYGRKKYSEWNWAKGMRWSVPLACAARHALAILEGDDLDPESKLPHVGHLLCNLVMLRHYVDCYPEGNDLPAPALFEPPVTPAASSPPFEGSVSDHAGFDALGAEQIRMADQASELSKGCGRGANVDACGTAAGGFMFPSDTGLSPAGACGGSVH